jgi:hypothetical protein
MSASELDKRLTWVRSGGRCLLCHEYLVEDHLEDSAAVRQIGEVAHIASEAAGGPRGDSDVPLPARNDPSNLILLCPNEHRSADKLRLEDPIYTEEFLLARKREWEAFVKMATGLDPDHATTVFRMVDTVKFAPTIVSVSDASKAVMSHSRRMPQYLLDLPEAGPDIDLANVPDTIDDTYWTSSLAQINEGVERLHHAAKRRVISHVSVFAIAHVPLLVALGNRIDDTISVDIYNKQRCNESWSWDTDAEAVPFAYHFPESVGAGDEGVLIVNASGDIKPDELPEEVRGLPTFRIAPADGHTPSTSTFDSSETQKLFDATVRSFLAELEVRAKHIRRLHLFAAVPVSAAVALGRRLPVNAAAPRLALYHRANDTYTHAFDIPLDKDA